MITLIVGTNRPESQSRKVTDVYAAVLKSLDVAFQILDLTGLDIYTRNEQVKAIEQQYLIPADKLILILPEYNGSFPGIFKLLIDNSDIRQSWYYKKAMLVGVADGRAGNLRGLEHMTNILHYLRINVFYQKVYLSSVSTLFDAEDNFSNERMYQEIMEQCKGFEKY